MTLLSKAKAHAKRAWHWYRETDFGPITRVAVLIIFVLTIAFAVRAATNAEKAAEISARVSVEVRAEVERAQAAERGEKLARIRVAALERAASCQADEDERSGQRQLLIRAGIPPSQLPEYLRTPRDCEQLAVDYANRLRCTIDPDLLTDATRRFCAADPPGTIKP